MREQGSVWPRERMPREGPNRPMGGLGPNTHQNIGSRAYPSMRSNHRGRSRDPWDPANRPPVPPAGMPSHGNTRPPGPFPPIGHLSVKDMEEIGRYNEARLESGLPPDPYYRSRGSHHPPSMRNNHRPEHIDFTDPRYRPPVPPNATGGSLGGNFHRTIDPNAYPPRQIDRPGSNRPRGSFHPPSMRNNHRPEHIDFTDPRYRPPVPPNAMPSRRRRF